MEHRVTILEQGQEELKSDIKEIKEHVTNHLVHALADTNDKLKILLDRKQATDIIKGFANNFLKLSFSLATATWAILQIVRLIKNWNL